MGAYAVPSMLGPTMQDLANDMTVESWNQDMAHSCRYWKQWTPKWYNNYPGQSSVCKRCLTDMLFICYAAHTYEQPQFICLVISTYKRMVYDGVIIPQVLQKINSMEQKRLSGVNASRITARHPRDYLNSHRMKHTLGGGNKSQKGRHLSSVSHSYNDPTSRERGPR